MKKNICDTCGSRCNSFDKGRGVACRDYKKKTKEKPPKGEAVCNIKS
jgi:hypothetical protein